MNSFSERLNILLAQRNWSRSKLARETGININTTQGYWQKNRAPNGPDLVRIAQTLRTSAEFLLTGREPEIKVEKAVLREIVKSLEKLNEEELIELRGVIRSHMFHFFRKPTWDRKYMIADKAEKSK